MQMPLLNMDALQRFPRFPLLHEPTVVQRLERLEAALGPVAQGVKIYVKRDDHMLVGGGGNKLRKLEFLLGQALEQGADTVITVGGLQSNHARLTAAAAARAGIKCELVLARVVPRSDADYEHNGNMLLNSLLGAKVHCLAPGQPAWPFAQELAGQLQAQGRKVYLIAGGGSTPVGALGYVKAALELQAQAQALGFAWTEVLLANGGSGTHAGLAAGLCAGGDCPSLVRSFSTLSDVDKTTANTRQLTRATLELLGYGADCLDEACIRVDGSQRGPAYGVPTEAMQQALSLLAQTEGLFLDPVYSGKAFAGMLADVRAGHYQPGQHVLFIMTGGVPGLYAYRQALA